MHDGVSPSIEAAFRGWPPMERAPEIHQFEGGPYGSLRFAPVLQQVAHLERIRDAPVLGPSANVLRPADEGFCLVHATMLHRGRAAGLSVYHGGRLGPGWRNWQTHGT